MTSSSPFEAPKTPLEASLPPFAVAVRDTLSTGSSRIAAEGETRAAAVLVALFEGPDGAPHVWLIRRPDTSRAHAGQVALPGGKRDPGDRDAIATALREAHEEIGLPSAGVVVLGLSDDLNTSTGYVVTPVVAWLTQPFALRANELEVSRAFAAPLAPFREQGVLGVVPIEALRAFARAYLVDGEIVWGATARMLHVLATRLFA